MRRLWMAGGCCRSVVMSFVAVMLSSILGLGPPAAARAASDPAPVVGGIGGYSYVVKAALPLVYMGSGGSVLVVDASDPKAPRLVGQSPIQPGEVFGIDVVGTRVYVAHGKAGLVILDVSNPASPHILGALDTLGEAMSLRVVGDTAYVADWTTGLLLIDVADPTAPRQLARMDTPGLARDVQVQADLAFVADMQGGLRIIDVSDPRQPKAISSIGLLGAGKAYRICVVGTWVFVASGTSSVTVIDVSVLKTPREVGWFGGDDRTLDLGMMKGMLVTVGWEGSMSIARVDLSTFQYGVVGSAKTRGHTLGMDIVGDMVFIADGDRGLTIIDASDAASPQIVGSLTLAGSLSAVTVDAGIACVVGPFSGLDIVDVSRPDAPRPLGSVAIADQATDVDMAGTTAYVTSRQAGLFLIDISAPAAPRTVGTVDTPGMAEAVQVHGGHAFVADTSGLLAVAIGDPTAPKIIGSLPLKNANDVKVVGDRAYVALLGKGMGIVDVSNPTAMRWLGGLDLAGGGQAIDVAGSVAYLVGSDAPGPGISDGPGLSIIDISDPSSPTLLGNSYAMPRAWNVAVADGRAYVATWLVSEGVFVYDVEEPGNVREVARWDTIGAPGSVFLDDDLAYVADSHAGLMILSTKAGLPNAGTPTRLPISPTPTRLPVTDTPTRLPNTATPTLRPPRWQLFVPYLQH